MVPPLTPPPPTCRNAQTSVVYHLLSLLVSAALARSWCTASPPTPAPLLPPSLTLAALQITLIAAMAYLVMALDIGDIWVRYADWLLSTPLLLVDLACELRCGAA